MAQKTLESRWKNSTVLAAVVTTIGAIVIAYMTLSSKPSSTPSRQSGDATTSGEKSPATTGDDNKVEVK